jgi:hypothetical protein
VEGQQVAVACESYGWWKTELPVGSVIAVGSEKPRTPGMVPK